MSFFVTKYIGFKMRQSTVATDVKKVYIISFNFMNSYSVVAPFI